MPMFSWLYITFCSDTGVHVSLYYRADIRGPLLSMVPVYMDLNQRTLHGQITAVELQSILDNYYTFKVVCQKLCPGFSVLLEKRDVETLKRQLEVETNKITVVGNTLSWLSVNGVHGMDGPAQDIRAMLAQGNLTTLIYPNIS